MFDRFTEHARKVMGLARFEALRLGHDYIGTEHLLLGLIREDSGIAADILKALDVDLKKIRQEVEKLVSHGTATDVQLPFTPRGKKFLELALEEASNLGHNYIGTEHLLLGLIGEQEGIAAEVLDNIGVDIETVRTEVAGLLGAEPELVRRTRYPASSRVARLEEENARLLEMLHKLEERVRKLEEKSGDG